MPSLTPKGAVERYRRAKERRTTWESHWEECYEFCLPHRDAGLRQGIPGGKKGDKVFDGTAPDAVDQLAASLMAQLTPPWTHWLGFSVGPDADQADRQELAIELEKSTAVMQSHFDRSNFSVEIHQCYLDLVTAGTASLLLEEAPPGERSAFRFTAVPLAQVVLEEGPSGRLDTTFRRSEVTGAQLLARFPSAAGFEGLMRRVRNDADGRFAVIEAVVPSDVGYSYLAVTEDDAHSADGPIVLAEGRFATSPFINFRWLKAPGETYGRSPVMKALPDIKTANKVVELVLKNASIAVTGIWQVDDDGVINPATIKLAPGTIIPKAVGSAGLRPLEAPGRFDVSQLILDQLRSRILKALLVDQLGQVNSPRMTATEVVERAAEMARILGATYGRLQSEMLTPLMSRAQGILARRGEILDLPIDDGVVVLDYKSPQARYQAQQDIQSTLVWLDAVRAMGPEALSAVDQPRAASWLGRALGVPEELIRSVSLPEMADDEMMDGLAGGLSKIAESVDQIPIDHNVFLPPDGNGTMLAEPTNVRS